MPSGLATFPLAICALLLMGAAPASPRLLVIVTGESNSGGYALNTEATPEELAPRQSVQILDNATLTFQPLDIGTNTLVGHDRLDPAATHGVELELANRADRLPADSLPVYLVKTGQGGSTVAQWAPDGTYFQTFRTRVAAAKKLLGDRPVRPVILFSLGINDAIAKTPVARWKREVKDHLARLRQEVGGDPPIVITRFMPRYDAFNAAIKELCAELQGVYSVETRDAALRDENHWNYAGMKVVAGRMIDVVDQLGLFPPLPAERPATPAGISFSRDIKGLLSNRCIRCHGPDAEDRHGGGPDGLRLDTFAGATADLDGHAAIVPGKPDASAIIARITSTDPAIVMPPPETGPPLTPGQIDLLRRWIAAGATYEPHWAYVPPRRPAVPAVKNAAWPRNDIDRFILARLEAERLAPQPEADRVTLARRLSLDLIGLPPTPEAVDAFVADGSPDAVDTLVDSLLAHDGFGEHMARQWLDLARYADTAGYVDDLPRSIWGWRDWVVRAYDANMPFDQFTIRQLAGDLLPGATVEDRIATAFHRNTPTNNEGGTDDEEFRTVAVIDRVNTTLGVWMGTTMACAQCHDHKYDPLSQKEYFQVYAILNNTADADRTGDPPHAFIPSEPADTQRRALQREIGDIEAGIPQLRQPVPKGRLEPPEFQPARRIIDDLRKNLAALPKQVTVPVLEELPPGKRRTTRIQLRGNFRNLGDTVGEGVPAIFNRASVADGERIDRLALAKWLVDPRNPLTARVVVNRLWERVFGIGLVSTSEEFGSQGELPSHPELLDWLATELVARGWDTKAILRMIVTSAAYRQTSKCPPDVVARDPENRLVACGPRVRLSAEVIRDQALAAAGLLSRKKGGPSVKPPQPAFGLGAAFGGSIDWKTSDGEDRYRRAIYTYWQRSNPYPSMAVFDAPAREVCTIRRPRTNTPLQALVTLNDPVYVEAAQALAQRMVREGGATPATRIVRGFRLVLARAPTAAETDRLVRLHDEAAAEFAADHDAAKKMVGSDERLPKGTSIPHVAACTVVANVILNLDETFMCP